MAPDAPFPVVPEDRLDDQGWVRVDERVETVFELPTAKVEGATVLYDDERSRTAVAEATGLDRQWRFFFATRLSFTPPLAPGIGPAMILPTVRSEAQSKFADQLREKGFEDVERGRSERVRVDTRDKARLRRYTASLPLPDAGTTLSVTGWVGVWHGDGFRVAAGAYPDRPLSDVLDVDEPPAELERSARAYRDDLLALIRAVE